MHARLDKIYICIYKHEHIPDSRYHYIAIYLAAVRVRHDKNGPVFSREDTRAPRRTIINTPLVVVPCVFLGVYGVLVWSVFVAVRPVAMGDVPYHTPIYISIVSLEESMPKMPIE